MGLLALDDYWFYLTEVLDYRFLDPWDHGEEMVAFLEEGIAAKEPMAFVVPRGGGKSSCITIPLLPWLIAKDPGLRAAIANVREPRAAAMGREAANILTSTKYKACFPYIEPSSKWGDKGYFIESVDVDGEETLGRIDPTIAMYGNSGNITGSHLRAILHDDLINEETANSPTEMERSERFFRESLNCIDPGGVFVMCYTRWRFNDFYAKVEDGTYQCQGKRFRVFKRGAERYALGMDGKPELEIFNPHRKWKDKKGQTFEVGYSPEFLESQKKALGPLYWALYQNDPTGGADRQLSVDQVRQYVNFPVNEWSPPRVGIEVTGQGNVFYQTFMQLAREQNYRFSCEQLKAPNRGTAINPQQKHARIRAALQPIIEEGRLYIREDVWRRPGGLGQEIQEFDRGEDDAIDALHWCVKRAPRYVPEQPMKLYLAFDPAFTANSNSDHSAIVVGGWYFDDFYVFDCHKFKAQKPDFIAKQVFRMWDKWNSSQRLTARAATNPIRQTYSPGNAPKRIQKSPFGDIWGEGLFRKENGTEEGS